MFEKIIFFFFQWGGGGCWNSCTTCSSMIRRRGSLSVRLWLMTRQRETCVTLIDEIFFRIISLGPFFFSNWEIFSNKNLAPFFHFSYSSISPISIGGDLIIFNLGTVSVCDGTSGEFHFRPDDEYHRHTRIEIEEKLEKWWWWILFNLKSFDSLARVISIQAIFGYFLLRRRLDIDRRTLRV